MRNRTRYLEIRGAAGYWRLGILFGGPLVATLTLRWHEAGGPASDLVEVPSCAVPDVVEELVAAGDLEAAAEAARLWVQILSAREPPWDGVVA